MPTKRNTANPAIILAESWQKIKEAVLANRYSSKKYSFDQAYKDARSKGQRTFFWNGKYYNTDYEGTHGKQYKADIASGKAAAWEEQYPGFTNPELRKEKQEELDTYGITNEQTKNKSWKDRQLKKIPARGYNVNDAISALLGEHHTYSQYNTADEAIAALKKKYPEFKNVEITGKTINTIDGKQTYALDTNVKKPDGKIDEDKWIAFKNDIESMSSFHRTFDESEEIHRPELNYLLGYPTIEQSNGVQPIISKYKTGNLPYYYTTFPIENSVPFIPQSYLDRGSRNKKYWEHIDSLNSKRINPNFNKLFENPDNTPTAEEWEKAIKKDDNLPQNKPIVKIVDKAQNDFAIFSENFINKMYDDPEYKKLWNNKGVGVFRGGLFIDFPHLHRANLTSKELDTVERLRLFNDLEQLPLTPGNRLAGTRNEQYYIADADYASMQGKYNKLINKLNKWIDKKNKSTKDPNDYDKETLNTKEFIYSEPSLGTYTYSVPKDSSYISVWDKFDINPFGSGNDKPLIQVGKPFEYYTRFYPEGKEPNIDSLYNTIQPVKRIK